MPKLRFHVQDAAGVGIPHAHISLTGLATTDADGWLSLTLPAGEYLGAISAPGYIGETRDWVFGADGTVLIGLEQGEPPPVPSADAIDLSGAIITSGTPDIRDWPLTTTITAFEIRRDGTIDINFGARQGAHAWPFVMGTEGLIQYTLGVGCFIRGVWYISTPILCIQQDGYPNYVPTGNTLAPNKMANDWYYYAGDPLASYDPLAGETVAWFVAAGALRRGDIHEVLARSNVITAPFRVGKFV